jgi:hypothetical protein
MVAFRNPKEYGRSILENSSFLASSENPDPAVHGRGYVARLSGSTTEAISIWIEMFLGQKVFTFEGNQLQLHFEPKLPGWMFDENGEASFLLLASCKVTYRNPNRKPTYGEAGAKIENIVIKDTNETINATVLSGELAKAVRDGKIKEIIVNFE